MKVHIAGLTRNQWIICLVVGWTSLLWNFVLKFVPDHICPILGDESEEDVRAAKVDYETLRGIASANK